MDSEAGVAEGEEMVRVIQLTPIVPGNRGVPFDKAFEIAEHDRFVLSSNANFDASQEMLSEISETSEFWTGTMTAYVEPGTPFLHSQNVRRIPSLGGGYYVISNDSDNGLRWLFPLYEEYLHLADAVLVLEYPDYELVRNGSDMIVKRRSGGKVDVVLDFPKEGGWAFCDPNHGIPQGPLFSDYHLRWRDYDKKTRFLERASFYVGPVWRGNSGSIYVKDEVIGDGVHVYWNEYDQKLGFYNVQKTRPNISVIWNDYDGRVIGMSRMQRTKPGVVAQEERIVKRLRPLLALPGPLLVPAASDADMRTIAAAYASLPKNARKSAGFIDKLPVAVAAAVLAAAIPIGIAVNWDWIRERIPWLKRPENPDVLPVTALPTEGPIAPQMPDLGMVLPRSSEPVSKMSIDLHERVSINEGQGQRPGGVVEKPREQSTINPETRTGRQDVGRRVQTAPTNNPRIRCERTPSGFACGPFPYEEPRWRVKRAHALKPKRPDVQPRITQSARSSLPR